jgi:hypothetical protein
VSRAAGTAVESAFVADDDAHADELVDLFSSALGVYFLAVSALGAEECGLSASNEDGAQIDGAVTGASSFGTPLWPKGEVPEGLTDALDTLRAFWDADPDTWGFWRRWYDGMLAGQPLPWDLQEQVALIPDDIWEAGPEAVAREIAKIEARFDALTAAREAKAYLRGRDRDEVGAANPMIGHNRPPLDEALPMAPPEIERLLAVVQSIQAQLEVPEPDRAALEAQAEEVEAARQTIGAWLADKLDMAASEFFKEIGKWSGRAATLGLGGAALWFLGLLDRLGPLVTNLWNYIRVALAG